MSRTAHDISREFKILSKLSSTPVRVPQVYIHCTDTSVLTVEFYVMEFIQGRIFSDALLNSVKFKDRSLIYFSMIRELTVLHKVDHGLPDPPVDFYARQIRILTRISKKQADICAIEFPQLDNLLDWFKLNAVRDSVSIIHGDYKLDNVVIDTNEPRVIGILDWELSTIGHPLSDLANMLNVYYIPVKLFGLKGSAAPGLPNVEDLISKYCDLMGIAYPIPNWDFCIAFSFFRMAVILQGIAARIKLNQASSEKAQIFADMFLPIARLALDFVEGGARTPRL